MAAAFIRRIRGTGLSSAEDSYDDMEYHGLSGDPPQNSDAETNVEVVCNDHHEITTAPIRRKRKGRRIVLPISAVTKLDLDCCDSKKNVSFWSYWKLLFTKKDKPQAAGLSNPTFDKNTTEPKLRIKQSSKEEQLPNLLCVTSQRRCRTHPFTPDRPTINVTHARPESFQPGSKQHTKKKDLGRGAKQRQRVEKERARSISSGEDNAELLSRLTTPFSVLYPKAFLAWKKKRKHFLSNKIKTTKYTILSFIPKNLFEQFHRLANFYFLLIIILNFLPMINSFDKYVAMVPLAVVLGFTAAKDIIEDLKRYRNDKRINKLKVLVYNRADDKYHNVKWKNVEVGDIVRLFCNRVIPADILLLHSSDKHGICYIETSNIDGETNLKQRMVCKGVEKHFNAKNFTSLIQCEKPNSQIEKFNGNIINSYKKESINKENLLLRGCVIRNTDYVEGIVVYAGHETKAMLNNNGPRYKRSKLERRMNLDVIWCVMLLVIMCLIGAVGNGVWAAYQSGIEQSVLFIPPAADGNTLSPALSGFYMFWTMVILLQILIPISLYVSIEIVKVAQVYFINNDLDLYDADSDKNLECRALNITEDLGQVQYIFSDKTGTLTENSMVFKKCTVGGVDYPHAANAARIENKEPSPPDMNPATNNRSHRPLRQVASAGAPSFRRDGEHRASYRRPGSSSVRAHHRRNPSQLSVKHLQPNTTEHHPRSASVTDAPGTAASAPNTPNMRRAISARASARRLPHKHHRRNISAVSAKEIMSNLAPEDQDLDVDIHDEDENEEEFLETDVTPDPVLYKELESLSRQPNRPDMASDKRRILDFFINLAICNTVVLSTDNSLPKSQVENFESVSSAPIERFRSLNDDIHEATNNLYTISGEISDDSQDSSSNLNNSNSTGEQILSFTPDYLRNLRYEAESPDEAALVYAAHAYGCSLAHRTKDTVTVTLPKSDKTMTFEVLHTLGFDSTRKRMSVIVRDKKTKQYILYCKGADSTILNLLRDPSRPLIPEDTDSGNGSEHSSSYSSSYQESNDPKVCQTTNHLLDQYARTGLRTLCIAKRVLSESEYNQWADINRQAEQAMENRDQKVYNSFIQIEKDLELLGATGVEDRLQDGVPETIEALRNAGMQVWVITGDKQETAVNIGYSCKLIEPNDEVIYLNAQSKEEFQGMLSLHNEQQHVRRGPLADISPDHDESLLSFNALVVRFRSNSQPTTHSGEHPPLAIVIDGKTLEHALSKEMQKDFIALARRCHSVLVCRATPLQKGEVVKMVKDELHVLTLAIGDGANDVSMIQVADIGVGISGQEGMQAVMSSDFAMARFRFLQRLLLVHGHWNYARLAAMVLYFFYKNAAFVFLIFWFQFFCGFSGANPIEQWYLLLFNLLFTSVPPLVNGALDKDVSSVTLLKKPRLYLQGVNNELYTPWSFWINILDALYQSLAMFLIPYFTYQDTDVGLVTWGTPVTTACMFANLIHLGIETKTWTWIHWACQFGSIAIFFVFSLFYDAVCLTCTPTSPYWITQTLVQTTNFWFSVILATVIAVLPRYIIRALQSTYRPSECQRERIFEKLMSKKEGNSANSTAATSMTGHSADSSSSTHQNVMYDGHENAVDAMQYDYGANVGLQDQAYHEVSNNTNANNSNRRSERMRPKSAPASRHIIPPSPQQRSGLANPSYIDEEEQQQQEVDDSRVSQNMRQEPETGETSPITEENDDIDSSQATTSYSSINSNNKENSLMKTIQNHSDNESDAHGGMTPVGDRMSLASEGSLTPTTRRHRTSHSSITEASRTTRLYVSSESMSDHTNRGVTNQLPNMAERSETNTPVGIEEKSNFYHTVA